MPSISEQTIRVVGIDIGKNSFHIVGLDERDRAAAEVVARSGFDPTC